MNYISGLEGGTDLLQRLIHLALDIKATPERWAARAPLQGKVFTGVFLNPSLRTRTSFESGIARLGGHMVTLEPGKSAWGWEFEQGSVMDGALAEHIVEAAGVLSSYSHAIGIRSFGAMQDWELEQRDRPVRELAQHATVPVISLESSRYHPCQALADAVTLHEVFPEGVRGRRFTLTWAYHPKTCGVAVPHSAVLNAARLGMNVTLAHPAGFELNEEVVDQADQLAQSNGGSLSTTSDMAEACRGAHVVYAKAWGSRHHYGDPEGAARKHREYRDWTVNEDHMASSENGCFMHCLPVRRNVVVTDGVLDSTASVVQQQAANRLWAQMALLLHVLDAAPSPPAN